MAITLRLVKGSELTFNEMDDNFMSFYHSSSVSGANIVFHKYAGSDTVTVLSASYAGTASYTPNAYVSSSANGNIISFVKGDGSVEALTVNTGSLPAGILSSSAQIATDISGAFTIDSASLASDVADLIIASGSTSIRVTDLEDFSSSLDASFVTELELAAATASFYESSSVNLNEITFFQGDGTTETVIVDTGSLPSGLLSSSAQIATDISGAFNSVSASLSASIADLENFSSSLDLNYVTEAELAAATASFYESSSVNLNTITFFQGDGTTETVTIDTGSLPSGLLSSSAQIATDISGAFTNTSASLSASIAGLIVDSGSVSTRVTDLESLSSSLDSIFIDEAELAAATASFYYSSSVVLNEITFYQGDGTTDIVLVDTGSSLPTGLLSSSAQIATDISGAFTSDSASIASDIAAISASFYYSSSIAGSVISFNQGDGTIDSVTVPTTTLPAGLLSSSAQIATDISGAFTSDSASIASDIAAISASFYYSSSIAGSVISFNQGDGSVDSITVPGGGGTSVTSASAEFGAVLGVTKSDGTEYTTTLGVLPGTNNRGFGINAGRNITTGNNIVVIGDSAGTNAVGSQSTIVGSSAATNAQGSQNTMIGYRAGTALTTGFRNTSVGANAFVANTTGNDNTVVGTNAGSKITGASNNAIMGMNAAQDLTTGNSNVAIGFTALANGTTAAANVAVGTGAMVNAVSGVNQNTAVGNSAATGLTTGNFGVYIGARAGNSITTATEPVVIGYQAGQFDTTGSFNTTANDAVYVGTRIRSGQNGSSNEIVIGANADGFGTNTATIGDSNVTLLYSYGTLTNPSDKRLKDNIEDLPYGLDEVEKMRAVEYDMKVDGRHELGFIAQEMKKIVPDVVKGNEESESMMSIQYTKLIPVLANAIKELSAEVKELKRRLEDG